jgi:hypothetical protein
MHNPSCDDGADAIFVTWIASVAAELLWLVTELVWCFS